MANAAGAQYQNGASVAADGAAQALPTALRRRRWAGLVLVFCAFLLYLFTLDNGFMPGELAGGDLITHQYAQVQARPSNAPGYPLYTMGGWLWFHSLRPLLATVSPAAPNPIPILSSYSTLWALLAVWLLYANISRATMSNRHPAGNWPIAWLLAAFYAVTYFFWYYATTTEQYSSAIAQTLAIVYVYQLWANAERKTGSAESTSALPVSRSALLYLMAFLCGLSLAHMLTIAFIVPPLVFVILWQEPSLLRDPRAVVGSVIAAGLPLLAYGYVYVRGAAHPEWWGAGDWANANEWFWSFVSTAQGREELGWGFEPGAAFFGNGFPELMWQELSIPFFVLGIVGILLLDRKLAVLLYGFSALTLLFSWAYRYGNWYQVILPVYPLLLMGVAAVFDRGEAWLAERSHAWEGGAARAVQVVPLLLLAGALVWRIDASLPAADSRDRPEDSGLDRAALLIDLPLPAGASLFAAVDDALALQYLTEIWGLGNDALSVSSREAAASLIAGAPLLSTWEAAPTLAEELPANQPVRRTVISPDWIAFHPADEPASIPTPAVDVQMPTAAGVTLRGFDSLDAPDGAPVTAAQPGLDVTLHWQTPATGWPLGVNISVRPTVGGNFIADPTRADAILQQDRALPADGLGDSLTLTTGDMLMLDPYRFEQVGEADGLLVLLYRATDDGFENLAEMRLPLP